MHLPQPAAAAPTHRARAADRAAIASRPAASHGGACRRLARARATRYNSGVIAIGWSPDSERRLTAPAPVRVPRLAFRLRGAPALVATGSRAPAASGVAQHLPRPWLAHSIKARRGPHG